MTCLCFLFKLEGYKCYWCVYIHWIIAWYLAKVPIGQKLIIFWKYSWKLQPLSFLALTLKVFFVFAVDIWSHYLVWLILNVLVGGISTVLSTKHVSCWIHLWILWKFASVIWLVHKVCVSWIYFFFWSGA